MGNPFEIFPEELWDEVLDRVDDSEDVSNVLSGIPQTAHLHAGKQFNRQIGAIMPLLFPKYLSVADMKACRQVSKRWRNSMSKIIEQHPDHLPYKSHKLRLITETHFNYASLPRVETNFGLFCAHMSRIPYVAPNICTTNNPFLGGAVRIIAIGDRYVSPRFQRAVHLTDSVPVLEVFGHYISRVNIHIPHIRDVNDIFRLIGHLKPLVDCLRTMPNLKSLEITSRWSLPTVLDSEYAKITSYIRACFLQPFPFQLETLILCKFVDEGYNQELYHHLFKALVGHQHVRKLGIRFEYWTRDYVSMFPNLNELCLNDNDGTGLNTILEDLSAAPIRKLRIQSKEIFLTEILQIISPYNIEVLELVGEIRDAKPMPRASSSNSQKENSFLEFFSRLLGKANHKVEEPNPNVFMTSVRSITLVVDRTIHLPFEFLLKIYTLEYLNIEVDDFHLGYFYNAGENELVEEDNPSTFGGFLKNLYNSRCDSLPSGLNLVWKEHPDLKMIRVKVGRVGFQYVQELGNRVFKY